MGELKLVTIEGVELQINGDGEPRIQDLTLATKLGYERPRDVRKLIERLVADGKLNESEVRATVAQTSPQGGRPGREYWLTEEQALFVSAKSETEVATSVLKEIIHVYYLARRGMLPASAPAPAPQLPVIPLGVVQLAVLRHLSKTPAGALQSVIAKAVGRPVSKVHAALFALERRGMVRRESTSHKHGPANLWFLADPASPALRQLPPPTRSRRLEVVLPGPARETLDEADEYAGIVREDLAQCRASLGTILAEATFIAPVTAPEGSSQRNAMNRLRTHAILVLELLNSAEAMAIALAAAARQVKAA